MYHALARPIIGRRVALASTVMLPFVVPLPPYALMELPHLVSAALVLGALLLFSSASTRTEQGSAFALSLASGLAVGFGVGVRLQNIAVSGVLIAATALRARRRVPAVAGQVIAQGVCIAAMVTLNRERFSVEDRC